jgi:hypothetical protein
MSDSRPYCATCGFLARRNVKTSAIEPCTQEQRGWMGFDPYQGGGMPYCAKLEHDLEAEWKAQLQRLRADTTHGGNLHCAAVSAVTYSERTCAAFRQWDPLRSPKEHEELEFVERLQTLYQQQAARQQEFYDWQQAIAAQTRGAHRLALIALMIALVALLALAVLCHQLAGLLPLAP